MGFACISLQKSLAKKDLIDRTGYLCMVLLNMSRFNSGMILSSLVFLIKTVTKNEFIHCSGKRSKYSICFVPSSPLTLSVLSLLMVVADVIGIGTAAGKAGDRLDITRQIVDSTGYNVRSKEAARAMIHRLAHRVRPPVPLLVELSIISSEYPCKCVYLGNRMSSRGKGMRTMKFKWAIR